MIELLKEYKEKYIEKLFSKTSLNKMISNMLKGIDKSEIRICNHRKSLLQNLK